jgi:hypothetical protein
MLKALAVALVLVFFIADIHACEILYPNPGTPAPTCCYTATNTGNIDAWYYGSTASSTDYFKVIDVTTGASTGWLFDNRTTASGAELVNILAVNAGDLLEFQLDNTSYKDILSSIPADNPDGFNHAYATQWTGGTIPDSSVSVPSSIGGSPVTYIGMEDLTKQQNSDFNYGDGQYLLTDVSYSENSSCETSATPEPGTILLLGTGMLGLVGFARNKLHAAQIHRRCIRS